MKTQARKNVSRLQWFREMNGLSLVLVGLGILITISFSWLFFGSGLNQMSHRAGLKESERGSNQISYVMGRIRSAVNLFSIEGRKVNRVIHKIGDLDQPQKTPDKKQVQNISGKNNTKENKTQSEKAKAQNTKSKKATAVTRKRDTPTQRSQLTQAQRNQRNFRVEPGSLSRVQQLKQPEQVISMTPTSSLYVPPSDASTGEESTGEPSKKVKTIEQWRSEIIASSQNRTVAREVIVRFVSAYRAKELTDLDFYQTVQGLLKSSDENQKGLGLYALRGTPSLASYTLLVKQQKEFAPELQSYIQETLLSYNISSPGTLNQALKIQDNEVILKTLEILKVGVMASKNEKFDTFEDRRYSRDLETVRIQKNQFLSFRDALTQLSRNTIPQIAGLAAELIQLIGVETGASENGNVVAQVGP